MNKKVEILSPAGSYESLKAAVAAGADAVYIGGTRFGARAYANNLQEEELLEAIDYVHLHGRKIYLTVNTLLKEHELKNELYHYLLPYYRHGLDAVIVQDIGVLQFIKQHFPDLSIHASTQMTITNLLGARFLEELGVERVVTARELQLHEIEAIAKHTNLEIESFVHGALCYCYSGQCLYSSLIGGRSGNRGQCAQPCRLPYSVNGNKDFPYVLSLKDICTLEYIPEMIEAGIFSFKIEGRMKKPEYVALVTAMYRKYVDLYLEKGKEGFAVEPKDREMLLDLYNRGGSHGGYYHTKNGREMLSLKRPNHAGVPVLKIVTQNGKNVTAKAVVDIHKGDVIELSTANEDYTFPNEVREGQNVTFAVRGGIGFQKGQILNRTRNESLISDVRDSYVEKKIKEKINGKLMLSLGKPSVLQVRFRDYEVEVTGDEPEAALNQPMSEDRIEKQIRKTGNTDFEFEQLEIVLNGNLFMPMQSLNELRRRALELLKERALKEHRRDVITDFAYHIEEKSKQDRIIPIFAYVEELVQMEAVLDFTCIARIYIDCNMLKSIWKNDDINQLITKVHMHKKEIYLAMPHIFREETIRNYEMEYAHIFEADWDGVLIRNYESYEFLQKHQYPNNIVTDYNLYQFNQYAKNFWSEQRVESTTAPLELNYKELEEVGLENSELVVYGYLPMMMSAQCVTKTCYGCKRQKGQVVLKDRYHKEFTVKNLCDYCYNMIYNTTPLVLTDQKREILDLKPKAMRLHFTIEDAGTVQKVVCLYEDVFCNGATEREPESEFTRGHFKRGIK